jgi:hypothetical protein
MKAFCFCGKHTVTLKGKGTLTMFEGEVECLSLKPAEDATGSSFTVGLANCGTRFEPLWSEAKRRYTKIRRTKTMDG